METQPQPRESEPDQELESLRLELMARLEADDDPAIKAVFTPEEIEAMAAMEMDFEETFGHAYNLMTCAGIDADDYWAAAGIAAPVLAPDAG